MERYDLSDWTISEMFDLYSTYYNSVTEEGFRQDLETKNKVGMFLDDDNNIKGFTTFAINPAGSGTEDYNIIFSGATVMDQAHWGGFDMIRGWCRTVGKLLDRDPDKKHYWFLITKGHKTYLYFPFFFKNYIPSLNTPGNQLELKRIMDKVAYKMYGNDYDPLNGVIRFPDSRGELKPALAADTFHKKHKEHVSFFLKRNPNFYCGEELACLAELHPQNMKGIVKNLLFKKEGVYS
jgi:hypothetical protein